MATTGVFNGTKMLLQMSTDGGSGYTTIGHATSSSFSFSMDKTEVGMLLILQVQEVVKLASMG